MSSEVTGNPASYPVTVEVPSDGDPRLAQTVANGLTDLADRTEHLKQFGIGFAGVRNWQVADADLASFGECRGGDYSETYGVWVIASLTDLAFISYDDGRTWELNDTGMASTAHLMDVAIDQGSNVAVAVSASGANVAYRQTNLLGGSWSAVTMTGLAVGIAAGASSIVWDPANDTFIVVGWESSGTTPYVATSSDAGATFTERTAPAGFPGLGSLAVSDTGIAVAGTVSPNPHTKLMFSADGGVTWSASTSTLASACYDVAYNQELEKFIAVPNASGPHYTSDDGDTWVQVFTGNPANVVQGANNFHHNVVPYGRAWLRVGVATTDTTNAAVALSTDGGVTWERIRIWSSGPRCIFSDATGTKALVGADSATGARILGSWRRGAM